MVLAVTFVVHTPCRVCCFEHLLARMVLVGFGRPSTVWQLGLGDAYVSALVLACAAGVFTGVALPFAYGCMMLVLW